MLVRVGQPAKTNVAAMTSRAIESLLSSLTTPTSQTIKFEVLSGILSEPPLASSYDAFWNLVAGRYFPVVYFSSRIATNSQSKGAPLVALPSYFKAGLTKQCFVYEEERHAGNAAAVPRTHAQSQPREGAAAAAAGHSAQVDRPHQGTQQEAAYPASGAGKVVHC